MSPGCTGEASFSLREVMPATKTSIPPLTVTTCECVARTGKSAGLTIFLGVGFFGVRFFGRGIARLIAAPGVGVKRRAPGRDIISTGGTRVTSTSPFHLALTVRDISEPRGCTDPSGNTFEFKGLKEPTPAQLLARR